MADELGFEVRVAHFPPYCSKYNPAEHRCSRTSRGPAKATCSTCSTYSARVETARRHMAPASTAAGLSVTADVLDRVYAAGRKVAADVERTTRIAFDESLPKWNYRAIPAP